MSDFERFLHATPKEGTEAGGDVGRLLKEAGARPAMPSDDFTEIKQAVRAQWQEMVRTQQTPRHRWGLGLAMAASLALALAAAWWWQGRMAPQPGVEVATVLKVEGVATDPNGSRLEVGGALADGDEIVTGVEAGRVALRLAGGGSVRFDLDTRARLVAGDRVELEQGAMYFDSTGAAANGGIRVATAFGTVRDIGTRFEVRLDRTAEDPLRVRVREGAVALDQDGASHSATGGEELRLSADGEVTLAPVAVYGEEWAWVLEAGPAFDIDGQPLRRYLEWVTRETGLAVRFENPALENSASQVVLGGTIEELTAEESLDVILSGSGMGYRVEDGALLILAAPSD